MSEATDALRAALELLTQAHEYHRKRCVNDREHNHELLRAIDRGIPAIDGAYAKLLREEQGGQRPEPAPDHPFKPEYNGPSQSESKHWCHRCTAPRDAHPPAPEEQPRPALIHDHEFVACPGGPCECRGKCCHMSDCTLPRAAHEPETR